METKLALALFKTPIGHCAIAWSPAGIRAVQLPCATEHDTRARLLARFGDADESAPTAGVAAVIDAIARLLHGAPSDMATTPLDLHDVPSFYRRVYESARRIPPGSTVSYGELARHIGSPGAARAVGQALARNPLPILVPCHRVLAAGGKVGGFTAAGGTHTKLRMLALERGAPVSDLVGQPSELPLYTSQGAR